MSKRLRIILLVTASLAVIMLGRHFYERIRQPKYAGRTVSEWFEQYYRSGSWVRSDEAAHEEAAKAIRGMGTNAIPFLLAEAFTTKADSTLRTNFSKFVTAFPASWNLPAFACRDITRTEAADAIHEIKPRFSLIMPTLQKPLSETNTLPHRQALYLLGCIGEDANKGVPHLVAALKETDPLACSLALQSLMWIGPQARAALPDVMQVLTNTNSKNFKVNAASTLAAMGSNAAPALGILKEMFTKETVAYTRETIAIALYRIDDHQAEALKYLLAQLHNNRQPGVRRALIYHLRDLGPAARVAIPDLLELMDDDAIDTWFAAAQLLKTLEVAPELYVPKLEQKLKSDDRDTRNNAAQVLIQLAPGHTEAMNYLIKCLEPDSPLQMMAVGALENAGPSAKVAIPALRQALKAKSDYVRKTAAKALKSIEKKEGK